MLNYNNIIITLYITLLNARLGVRSRLAGNLTLTLVTRVVVGRQYWHYFTVVVVVKASTIRWAIL